MKNMFNNSKFMDRFFRRVDGVVWDLMSGRVGIKNADGIVTIEGVGADAQVVINLFDQFGLEVPAFAQNTPVDAVAVGDLIYGQKGVLGWVVDKTEKSFTLLKPEGTRSQWSPPKIQMFGFDSGVMVLRSLMNMLPGGSSGLNQMQSLLMPMLMMGDGDIDLGNIMPMLLFSQVGQQPTDPTNPNGALLAQNQMAQMMQMMMMAQLMGGKSEIARGFGKSSNFFDK